MGADHPCPWCGYKGPHQTIPITFGDEISLGTRQRWGTQRVLCGHCHIQEVWDPPDPPGDGLTTPDLRLVHPEARAGALRYLEAGNPMGVLCAVQSHQAWNFFADNHRLLLARGLYEPCLLEAYSLVHGNLRDWPPYRVEAYFLQADSARLRAAGDPLPAPAPTTLYRGVAGRGWDRRIRGFSWTSALACACWFARRFALPDPAVYQLPYRNEAVLAYTNGRREQEYLVHPFWVAMKRPKRVRLTPDEMQAQAALWAAQMRHGHTP